MGEMLYLIIAGLKQKMQWQTLLYSTISIYLTRLPELSHLDRVLLFSFLIPTAWWCLLLFQRYRFSSSAAMKAHLFEACDTAFLRLVDLLRCAVVAKALARFTSLNVFSFQLTSYCIIRALFWVPPLLSCAVHRAMGGAWADVPLPPEFLVLVKSGAAATGTPVPWWRRGATDIGGAAENRKKCSSRVRVTSLAPSSGSGGEKNRNNNDRCRVVDEGEHFNRTARGCLISL